MPWNKSKIVGQKAPFKLKDIWAIRVRLQLAERRRELALFNLAIDSKLRACDLVKLRVRNVCHGQTVASRTIVMLQKTQRPVQFEITEPTREAVGAWIGQAHLTPESSLFPSRLHDSTHLSTRQYARKVDSWVRQLGLDKASYGTQTLRRTKAKLIYRRTNNLRAVQLLLGNTKLEGTVRYLPTLDAGGREITAAKQPLATYGKLTPCLNNISRIKKSGMRALFLSALAIGLALSSVMTARANGLVPCDSRSAGLVEDLSDDSKAPSPGEVVLSYLDLPGLQIGWGLQLIRFDNRFVLRSVQFRRDWRGGYIEVRPGVFGANPVQPDPLVRTVSLSASLAERLRAIAIAEIAHADQTNARMGLDGEGFYFYADGKCAWVWSPDKGSDPARLADIFHDLKTQALLPTRLVQLFWEKRIVARLNQYSGNASMSVGEYLIVLAVGVGIVAVGALPLLIAWLLTFFSKKLQSKRRFVAVSGALSYGFTCFIGLLLLPFLLLGSWVSAELDVDGHSDLAFALDVVVKYSVYVLLNAALVFAVAVPVYLRRKWSTSPTLVSGAEG